MISKSTIAAMVLVTMLFAPPAVAQVPGDYYGYPGAYAYPYGQPAPLGWAPYYDYGGSAPYYGYGGWTYSYWSWSPNNPASIDNNIHAPSDH